MMTPCDPIQETERIDRLRLFRSESVGPVTFYRLMARFGTATRALDALPGLARRGGRVKAPKICSPAEVERELSRLHDYGGRMVVYGDPDYPALLAQLEDAPPAFSLMGHADMFSDRALAVVGARNASANARRFAAQLCRDAGRAGWIIVSGMARGIDTAAHEAALDTGTIAVLAGGIDEIYPQENTDLYLAISERGAVISEMPFGTKPTAHHFPRRNRIVSGLCTGTLVVEATVQSGSLITARLAAEQGREVFAVPGFPGDPRAAGPNALIQNGAKLVQCADDILSELARPGILQDRREGADQTGLFGIAESFTPFDPAEDFEPPATLYDAIMNRLSHTPVTVDEVIRTCGPVTVGEVQGVLLDLELAGRIHRHPGNRVSRAAA